jgi:hypothetical protein
VDEVEHEGTSPDNRTEDRGDRNGDSAERAERLAAKPPMAVSIAGVSTACSKDALVSSAKAVREALSTE